MTPFETFKLVCQCQEEIEIRCAGPHVCPRCNQPLDIQWRIEHDPEGGAE